jgi:hypothetical protein
MKKLSLVCLLLLSACQAPLTPMAPATPTSAPLQRLSSNSGEYTYYLENIKDLSIRLTSDSQSSGWVSVSVRYDAKYGTTTKNRDVSFAYNLKTKELPPEKIEFRSASDNRQFVAHECRTIMNLPIKQ